MAGMGLPDAIGFVIRRTFAATPDRVWPIVSDTDAFNEAIGLPPWNDGCSRAPGRCQATAPT